MSLRHGDPYDGPVTHGLDVSYAQPAVDWFKVAAGGYAFAFCKAGENDHQDHTFFSHYLGARAAGIVPGAYWYTHTETPPIAQASMFCDILEHVWKPGDLPPVADVERGLTDGHTADFILAFLGVVEKRMGVRPMLYSGHTVAELANDARLTAFDCWVPSYGHPVCQVPRPFATWKFWQVSARGRVSGVVGACDLDVYRGDKQSLLDYCTIAHVVR